jgi:hypothetical protein
VASYQDIDSRLGVVERQLNFILEHIPVTREERSFLDPSQVIRTRCTLKDLYREATSQLLSLVPTKEEENGSTEPAE